MGKAKQIEIESRTYYFYNDQINLRNFDSRLLKVDKKDTTILTFITLVMWLLKKLLIATIFAV